MLSFLLCNSIKTLQFRVQLTFIYLFKYTTTNIQYENITILVTKKTIIIRGLLKSIVNFEFPWIAYIRFRLFVALCWYSYPSLMLTTSAIWNVQLILAAILLGRVLARLLFLPIPKNESKNLYQNFREEWSVRNITCKLCVICAKHSARNARICGRTKIGFCTTITPLLTYRCLCANFWPKNDTIMLSQPTYFPDLAPCDFFLRLFLFPETEEAKIEDEPKHVHAK